MLTVGNDAAVVERHLSKRPADLPGMGGPAEAVGTRAGAGDPGLERDRLAAAPAAMSRCAGCGRTHMLLPVRCLARRADEAGVIGQALALAATGLGYRPIAERLGRPAATVRGWLRRAVARAGPLRSAFTALACGLDPDPLLPAPAGSGLADAVAAVVAAAAAAARRWGPAASVLAPWELASAVTMGALLAPG